MKNFIVYGSGGHASVVKDLIELLGGNVIAQYDETNVYKSNLYLDAQIVVAIGNPQIRSRIVQEVTHTFATLIHPQAYVSKYAKIDYGTVILANATIQAHASVGKHVIINSNVVIDHDAIIQDFVTTYPGTYVASGANVNSCSKLEPHSYFRKI